MLALLAAHFNAEICGVLVLVVLQRGLRQMDG